ncbi:receptor kinase-like protein Xa21 [Papaver somniferum]|uniref:receptor kinase-like protein Xa21 n=1 Tax=Papaver somniferum TaxID=3469 RepID=UPI000E6F9300|nr:receptor kinase-like protein Xa21 [Papaver somniferum]
MTDKLNSNPLLTTTRLDATKFVLMTNQRSYTVQIKGDTDKLEREEKTSFSIVAAVLDHSAGANQEVGKLKNLQRLFLTANRLSGEIPSTIGECLSLKYLYLDNNFVQGDIPRFLTFLEGLDASSLSHNNLSGVVPEGFENLALAWLDISYNNLEGLVPKDGVFKNISAFLFEGNKKLCGNVVGYLS